VVYIEGRIYIPNNKKIQKEILKGNHDSVDVGHPDQHRMLELLKRTYWWPGLKGDVKKYIDIIGPLPKSNGMDAIVVIVD